MNNDDPTALREAEALIGLVAAEFSSDPMSVQCFDLRVVERVKACAATLKANPDPWGEGLMNIAKHTPGPWFCRPVSEKSWHVGVYDATGTEVALIKVKSALSARRRDADAHVIAAALELLEAARAAMLCIGELSPTQARAETMQALQAAVTKAGGCE